MLKNTSPLPDWHEPKDLCPEEDGVIVVVDTKFVGEELYTYFADEDGDYWYRLDDYLLAKTCPDVVKKKFDIPETASNFKEILASIAMYPGVVQRWKYTGLRID